MGYLEEGIKSVLFKIGKELRIHELDDSNAIIEINYDTFPAVFNQGSNEHELVIIHPLPENQVIKVDSAGFGLTLMHKSIIEPIRAVEPDYSLFAEKEGLGDKYISEDIVFFRKLKKAGIPLYAHTGATVQHLKTFSFDQNYYNLYWNGLQKELFTKG
jgi:hypothetical protein